MWMAWTSGQCLFSSLIPELQLEILDYLDFGDKVSLFESGLLPPGLINQSKILNIHDEDGHALLHIAVRQNYETAVHILLSAGALASIVSRAQEDHCATPMTIASSNGNLAIIKMLLEHGASIHEWDYSGIYPIHYASQYGHTEVVKFLLEKGANQRMSDYGTPLHIAATYGHEEVMRALIASGPDLNLLRSGVTALWIAVAEGYTPCVRILLETGAPVVLDDTARPGWYTVPPLHIAAAGCNHIVQALTIALERNHDGIIHPQEFSWELGDIKSSAEMVELLINAGADVSQEIDSITPLHLATIVGNLSVVKILLNAGADMYCRTAHKRSPLFFARLLKHDDIVTFLSEAKKERPGENKPPVPRKPNIELASLKR